MVNEPDHAAWASAVDAQRLNMVQVTIYARQGPWDSADLSWETEHPSVVSELRAAKAKGLRTVLVLRVFLEHALASNRHLWHGMIWPRDPEAWFDRYQAFAEWGARFAAEHDVDLFVVGNELNSLSSTRIEGGMPALYGYMLDPERTGAVRARRARCAAQVQTSRGQPDLLHHDGGRDADLDAMLLAEERRRREWTQVVTWETRATEEFPAMLAERRAQHERRWRGLIASVRGLYSGPIGYGSNFDQFFEVGFWDALDAIGVTGYFPLSRYGQTGDQLAGAIFESWRGVAEQLEETAAKAGGKPVLFLELGWTRRAGSTVRPYSYHGVEPLETDAAGRELTCVHWGSQALRPAERVEAMDALARVVRAGLFPSLRGYSLWKLTTVPSHRDIESFAIVLPKPGQGDLGDVGFLNAAAHLTHALSGSKRSFDQPTSER